MGIVSVHRAPYRSMGARAGNVKHILTFLHLYEGYPSLLTQIHTRACYALYAECGTLGL
jgi:hypothetical protein